MKSQKNGKNDLRPLWIAIFSDIMGFSIMSPIFAYIVSSPIQASLLLSVNALFSCFSAPIWGRLSDKYGRKPMLGLSQLGTIAGFLIMAFSNNNITIIFISRIIDGIFGGNFPISKAILSDIVPPHERSISMSKVGLTRDIAQLFGPALGGILFKYTRIMGTGIVSALICIFSLFCSQFILYETAPIKTGRILYEEHLDLEIKNQTSSIIERKAKLSQLSDTKPKESLWKNKTFVILMMQTTIECLSMIIILSNINMFAKMKFDISVDMIGIILSAVSLFQIAIRMILMKYVVIKIGDYSSLLLGLTSQLIFYTALGFAPNVAVFIGLMSLKAFAGTLTKPVIDGYASKIADPIYQGKVQGISSAMNTLAQLIGPLIGGILLEYLPFENFGLVSCILAAFTIILTFMNKGLKNFDSKKLKMENEMKISEISKNENISIINTEIKSNLENIE